GASRSPVASRCRDRRDRRAVADLGILQTPPCPAADSRSGSAGSVIVNPAAASVTQPSTASAVAYEPVASKARPTTIGPAAPASPHAVQLKPYNVDSDRSPNARARMYGITSSSPPDPKPMQIAAVIPAASE